MEIENSPIKSPKPIISKARIKHSSTYTASTVTGIGEKGRKKKVMFTDKANNAPLHTIYNYEQVEVVEEVESPKSTSCACLVF
ncbi:hypothetical protein SteCoe_23813 [Stentor coeruleus]|uniref:Uncharacterized protein n=1 Tax=Stentor coeruleus TaxID=5963 RepID=A0A1R2BJ32_9CILI|nr:hypothetical protein SteCoe_23813 [Stentor coeruleus]